MLPHRQLLQQNIIWNISCLLNFDQHKQHLTTASNNQQSTINNQQQQHDVTRAHRAYQSSWWFHWCWPWDRHHLEGLDQTLSIRTVGLDQSSSVSAFQRAKNDICILLCLRALAFFSLFAQMDALCFQLWDGQRNRGNNTVSINWWYCHWQGRDGYKMLYDLKRGNKQWQYVR